MKMTAKEKELLEGIHIGNEKELIENPYSGVKILLEPEAVAIYDVIKGCEVTLASHKCQTDEADECPDFIYTSDLFYAARDVFINNWPKEYMDLLD